MKKYILTLLGSVVLGSAVSFAQDWDDIYYDTGAKNKSKDTEKKAAITIKKSSGTTSTAARNPYFTVDTQKQTKSATSTSPQIVNGRDVDEYNRRYTDEQEAYYAEEAAAYAAGDSANIEDFAYTDRLVKFHNPELVDSSEDAELIELYYDNRPTVNLIVGTSFGSYYDPFYWGGYRPYRSWYRPYGYGWYDSWYTGWYDPWYDPYYSWGYGWYGGWHNPWHYTWGCGYPHYGWHGPSWGHHGHYWPVSRPHINDGGRLTAGHRGTIGGRGTIGKNSVTTGRPGYASTISRRNNVSNTSGRVSTRPSTINRNNGASVNSSRPSTSVSRPGTTGSIRKSVGSSATENMSRRNSVTRSRSAAPTYNSNSSTTTRRSSGYSSGTTRSSSGSSYNSGSMSGGRSSGGYSGGNSGGSRGGSSSGGSRGGRR